MGEGEGEGSNGGGSRGEREGEGGGWPVSRFGMESRKDIIPKTKRVAREETRLRH